MSVITHPKWDFPGSRGSPPFQDFVTTEISHCNYFKCTWNTCLWLQANCNWFVVSLTIILIWNRKGQGFDLQYINHFFKSSICAIKNIERDWIINQYNIIPYIFCVFVNLNNTDPVYFLFSHMESNGNLRNLE